MHTTQLRCLLITVHVGPGLSAWRMRTTQAHRDLQREDPTGHAFLPRAAFILLSILLHRTQAEEPQPLPAWISWALGWCWGEGAVLPLHTLWPNGSQPSLLTMTTYLRGPTWLPVHTHTRADNATCHSAYPHLALYLPHRRRTQQKQSLSYCPVNSPGLHGDPSTNRTGASEERGSLVGWVGALPIRHGASKTADQPKHTVKDVATCPFLLLCLVRPQKHSAKDWLNTKWYMFTHHRNVWAVETPHNGFVYWYSLCTHISMRVCVHIYIT